MLLMIGTMPRTTFGYGRVVPRYGLGNPRTAFGYGRMVPTNRYGPGPYRGGYNTWYDDVSRDTYQPGRDLPWGHYGGNYAFRSGSYWGASSRYASG